MGGVLIVILLKYDLRLKLARIPHDGAAVTAYLGVTGIGEISSIVQARLPVGIPLVGISRQKHTGIIFTTVNTKETALIDLLPIAADRLCIGDDDIVHILYRFGRRSFKRNLASGTVHSKICPLSLGSAGHSSCYSSTVQMVGRQLVYGSCPVGLKALPSFGREQVYCF